MTERRVLAALAALLLCANSTVRPLAGQVIEARANALQTVYLWDATPYVIGLVHDHLTGSAGLTALEETAVQALYNRSRNAHSKNLTIRVLYQKTGAVNPVYGNLTFAGIERVFTLSAARSAVAAYSNEWVNTLGKGRIPAGLQIQITGKLPRPR